MDTARLQQIQSLFLSAADLPEGERKAFLDTACGNDDALRAEVLAMLREDAHDDSLLDGDLSQVARGILGERPARTFPTSSARIVSYECWARGAWAWCSWPSAPIFAAW